MGHIDLDYYDSIVFDCDGVILNSNSIKTEAFRNAAFSYGEQYADALVQYHVQKGGVSRYKKFSYFLEHIVGRSRDSYELQNLLDKYAAEVQSGLRACEIADGLTELRKITLGAKWFIVSGGAQDELRDLFAERQLAALFDGGIFGSPDTKDEIFAREIASNSIAKPAVFIGDSKYDHIAAKNCEIDFIFLSDWSEFETISEYSQSLNIPCFKNIRSLSNLSTA